MTNPVDVTIPPAGADDLAAVRELLREYQQSLGVDLSFQDFAHELQDLLGAYGAPCHAQQLHEDTKHLGLKTPFYYNFY